MEYFVIADEDTVLGFRYAGIEGRVAENAAEARSALADCIASGKTGVILVTDEIAAAVAPEVEELRFHSRTPLVVQIPGPAGPAPDRPDLLALIREAMGIKL